MFSTSSVRMSPYFWNKKVSLVRATVYFRPSVCWPQNSCQRGFSSFHATDQLESAELFTPFHCTFRLYIPIKSVTMRTLTGVNLQRINKDIRVILWVIFTESVFYNFTTLKIIQILHLIHVLTKPELKTYKRTQILMFTTVYLPHMPLWWDRWCQPFLLICHWLLPAVR